MPGVGPKRTVALLRHFGSLRAIEAATAEELASVPGMGSLSARRLQEALREGRRGSAEGP